MNQWTEKHQKPRVRIHCENHEIHVRCIPSGKLSHNYGKYWKITIFNGKIHYKWAIFNSYVKNYQRVILWWSFWILWRDLKKAVLLPGCSVSQKRNSNTDLPVPMPHKKQFGEFSHICEALTILDLFEQKPSLANLPNIKSQNWRTNYDKLHIFVRLLRPKLHVCKFLGKIWLCLNMGYPIISIHSPYNYQ